jgi:hypothetical protein
MTQDVTSRCNFAATQRHTASTSYSITSSARSRIAVDRSTPIRLGSLEVDDQFEFCGLFEGQIGGFRPTIRDQSARLDIELKYKHGRQPLLSAVDPAIKSRAALSGITTDRACHKLRLTKRVSGSSCLGRAANRRGPRCSPPPHSSYFASIPSTLISRAWGAFLSIQSLPPPL